MFSFKFHGADNTPITFHLSKDSKKILYPYSYMQRVADISGFARCGSTCGYGALAVGLGCSVLVVSPDGVSFAWFGALASCFRCVGSAPCGGLLWVASPVPFPAPPVGCGQLSLL